MSVKLVTSKTPAAHVKEMVRELSNLGRNNAENMFRMTQILAAFKEQRLYDAIGYDNFAAFAEGEEIKIGKSAAAKWANFYIYAKEMGYNKGECIEILEHLSVNAAHGQLFLDDKKTSVGAFIRRCRKDYLSSKYQINIGIDNKTDMDKVHKVLQNHGMEINEQGHRSYLSEAFLSVIKSAR